MIWSISGCASKIYHSYLFQEPCWSSLSVFSGIFVQLQYVSIKRGTSDNKLLNPKTIHGWCLSIWDPKKVGSLLIPDSYEDAGWQYKDWNNVFFANESRRRIGLILKVIQYIYASYMSYFYHRKFAPKFWQTVLWDCYPRIKEILGSNSDSANIDSHSKHM